MRDEASRRTRRQILRDGAVLTGALAFPGVFAACGDDGSGAGASNSSGGGGGGAKKASGKVVYADGGGTTREARRKAFLDPFQQQSGIKVVSADGDSAKFKLMAE